MAISFAQSDDPTADWCRADQGSGRAFFAALDRLSQKTGTPSLKTAPITVMGVCAAGQFAFHLAAFLPARVRAFVTIGGGKHDLSKVEAASKAPALIVVAHDRPAYAVTNLNALYAEGRSHSAPWLRVFDKISNYDAGMCSIEVLSFLNSSLVGEADQSQSFKNVPTAKSGDVRYLPFSICGKRLSNLVCVDPATIVLTDFESHLGERPTCSLVIQSAQNGAFDEIIVPVRDSALRTNVRKLNPEQWIVDCWVNQEQLPIGASRLEVPIRFSKQDEQIPGGTKSILNCIVSGEVACVPPSLNFGVIKAGEIFKKHLQLVTKDGSPLRVESIESTYPWIQAVPDLAGNDYLCTATPPAKIQSRGFAGYLKINMTSPARRSIRIFYYGSIDKSGNSDPGGTERE